MPACDELRDFVSAELRLPESDGEYLFHHWTENGFTRRVGAKDVPIRDWRATARKWKSGGWFPSQKTNGKPKTDALGRPTSSNGFKNPLHQDFDPREVLR